MRAHSIYHGYTYIYTYTSHNIESGIPPAESWFICFRRILKQNSRFCWRGMLFSHVCRILPA